MTFGYHPRPNSEARGRSVVKPVNDCFPAAGGVVWRQNEDRFRIDRLREGVLAAISDGAGGAGIFCSAWARALVESLPIRPIADIDDFNAWMEGFCFSFRSEHAAKILGQPVKHGKFIREGSLATLSVCWLARRRNAASLRWLGYGDSPILVFDRSGTRPTLIAHFPGNLADLGQSPALLNWKDKARKDRLTTGALRLPARATIAVASDGVGHYLLLRYLVDRPPGLGGLKMAAQFASLTDDASPLAPLARRHREHPRQPFARVLTTLRAALKSNQAFFDFVRARHREGLMVNDDATLLLIDIDTPPTRRSTFFRRLQRPLFG